jgi:predicted XRE-type DNA-binding protein
VRLSAARRNGLRRDGKSHEEAAVHQHPGCQRAFRAEAANLKARAEVMIAIQEAVSNWRLTQAATAKRLGLTQPRLSDLLRGRINKFSLDAGQCGDSGRACGACEVVKAA